MNGHGQMRIRTDSRSFPDDERGSPSVLKVLLHLVVNGEHQGAAGTADNVRQGALKEGTDTLCLGNHHPAVGRVLVQHLRLLQTRLHHHPTTHRVEWIGSDTSHRGHHLGNGPAHVEGCVLRVGQVVAARVVEAKVGRSIDDDALDGDDEAAIQSDGAVALHDLHQAVDQAVELSVAALAHIGSESTNI